ncbi:hypothetical protein [Legionella fallonii]|uniref:Alpha/beta hydrolase n=1 Tax=Legionella fallonii LLAP-10 TaxID=1212491 RepID=A0A098G035_9GAMM|nr:hypothetical protein [Legionella fallonii]CEG55852.1 conserved protein of unknown function [Legionella fallonii LLAP-10]
MQKKKILILPSDTPHPAYIDSIISPLAFLETEYSLHPIDSLSIMEELSNEQFYSHWQEKLSQYIPHYDAFFGFSFGGVILQQCFSLFTHLNKPLILFSAPSFADQSLAQKLGEVITLCNEYKIDEALHSLYQHVYYPNEIPLQTHQITDKELAAKRIIYGLTRVLETDSTSIIKENQVKHLHLIGELSHLVNKDNVLTPHQGTLLSVPEAGMRILRDNLPFCKKVILEALNGAI